MPILEQMEWAIESAHLAFVSLKAAHAAPDEVAVRVCMEAAQTHLCATQDRLRTIATELAAAPALAAFPDSPLRQTTDSHEGGQPT